MRSESGDLNFQFSLCITYFSYTLSETVTLSNLAQIFLWPAVRGDIVHRGRQGMAVGSSVAVRAFDGLFIVGEPGSEDLKPEAEPAYNFWRCGPMSPH